MWYTDGTLTLVSTSYDTPFPRHRRISETFYIGGGTQRRVLSYHQSLEMLEMSLVCIT